MKYSLFLLIIVISGSAQGKTWLVGPTRQYIAPSKVENLVSDGDTVLVDSGTYVGDVATWNNNNLVLRCPNGMARFNANGNIAGLKGIWLFYGQNAYVEGFEFYGAQISAADGDNGAGIRVQGNNFTCRRCSFHDNQEGILTGNDTNNNHILIEACSFDHNGVETGGAAGYEHNIYIGLCSSATIKFCYFHASIVGHEVKCRANTSYILYNYIVDGATGDGSLSIDIPQGGLAYVIGNIIEKGPMTANSTVIGYGEEWSPTVHNPDSEFYFVNNTVVTDRNPTTYFEIASGTKTALIANTIFAGNAHPITGFTDTVSNVFNSDTAFFHFKDPIHYDYHPIANFPGLYLAKGIDYIGNTSVTLSPELEYFDPLDSTSRTLPVVGGFDHQVGAYESIYADTISDSVIIHQRFSGKTCLGDTDWEHIWIENTGNAGYYFGWSIYGPTESDFDIYGGQSKFIAPGNVDSFFIRFIPSINGVETDTLRIDGGKEQYFIIQDSGGSAVIAGHGTVTTPVGTTATFDVTICNTGTCDWTPGAPICPNVAFTYISGGMNPILPGGCDTLEFRFAPTAVGTQISVLEFPEAGSISIPAPNVTLTGTAISSAVSQKAITKIYSNFPNPFFSETLIPNISGSLKLFNECGNEMKVTTQQTENGILLERGSLPAGIYFYRVTQPEHGSVAEGSVVVTN